MEAMIPSIWQFTGMVIIWFTAFFLGFLLTEQKDCALFLKYPALFDMRPFNCRTCLSTHLHWITCVFCAYFNSPYWLIWVMPGSVWMYYILSKRFE